MMRHDPGVAASPPVCRRLEVQASGVGQADSSSSIPRCQAAVCSTSIEREDVQDADVGDRIREHRREPFEERVGTERTAAHQVPQQLLVLLEIASRIRDPDPRRDLHQLREVRDAGNAQMQRQGDPGVADLPHPARHRGRVEAHLRGHGVRVPLLLAERLEQAIVGDVGVALRIARHADLLERVAELVHRLQEHQPVVELAPVLRVASHDEDLAEAVHPSPLKQVGQVRPVAEHVRRDVGRHVVSHRRDRLGQVEGRFDPVRRRGRHGHLRPGRERRGALERVRERDQLVARVGDERLQRRPLLLGQAGCPPPLPEPPAHLSCSSRHRAARLIDGSRA